jgi:hypothetical protein
MEGSGRFNRECLFGRRDDVQVLLAEESGGDSRLRAAAAPPPR